MFVYCWLYWDDFFVFCLPGRWFVHRFVGTEHKLNTNWKYLRIKVFFRSKLSKCLFIRISKVRFESFFYNWGVDLRSATEWRIIVLVKPQILGDYLFCGFFFSLNNLVEISVLWSGSRWNRNYLREPHCRLRNQNIVFFQ